MDQMPQELIDIQQALTTLFWEIKETAERASTNVQNATSATDVDRVERTIRSGVLDLGLRLMEQYFHHVGTGDQGSRIERKGITYVRKHRERESSIVTSFGPVPYRHTIYYADNGESLRPLESMINLPARGITYLTQEIMTRLGMEEPYAESQSFYADFFGYSPSSRTIEQVTIEAAASYPAYRKEQLPMLDEPTGRIGVVSFDGKGVPVVPSERTTGKTREALVGCVYTIEPESRDAEQIAASLVMPETLSEEQKAQLHQRQRAENIQYFAQVAKPKAELFDEVQKAATARFDRCLPTAIVCLMDGALKLWQLAKTYFPNAVYILDLMHVLGYLRSAVTALEDDEPQARRLLCAYLQWILQGKVDMVIKSMRIRLSKNKVRGQKRKEVEGAITYFTNHREYMRYEDYLAAGYPIASGVIESACKHIVKNRMDRSGAQWSIRGAEAVLKLRCIKASGHWPKFCEIRPIDERNRLYASQLKTAA